MISVWLEQDILVARIRASLDLNEPGAVETASGPEQVLAAVVRFLAEFARQTGAGSEVP